MRYCPATLALTVALCLSTPGGSSALGRPPRATNALRGQSPPAPSRIALCARSLLLAATPRGTAKHDCNEHQPCDRLVLSRR